MDSFLTLPNYVELENVENPHFIVNNNSFVDMFLANDLDYDHFFNKYMLQNVPCTVRNIIDNWNGLNWIENNKPNFHFLLERYGKLICIDNYNENCKFMARSMSIHH